MRLLFLLLFMPLILLAQINPSNISIARDSFGVPHIFAPTDAEVAYGLAWAHAEDDFKSLQMVVLPSKGLMGKALGKSGAAGDYAFALFRCKEITEERWHTLSPEYIKLINGYVQGINDYARLHKKEWMAPGLFPITTRDYVASSVLALTVFNGGDRALKTIYGNNVSPLIEFDKKGSNAIAVHATKTATGENFLAVNAHQPNEGPQAFYEAHVCSEEGWNALGGLLAGGPVILHGVNEHLGWAHTVNLVDRVDIYQLQMNPKNQQQYWMDDHWENLEVSTIKLSIKGIPIKIKRKLYWSKYGATIKNKQGVFAIRLGANMRINALEQWYRMNKAQNFTQFYQALQMQELSMFNIMYADKYDTIFYINNALVPERNPNYNWKSTLPGNTSATLWNSFRKINQLPQYINPKSGFLFNTNHSPFSATGLNDNLKYNQFPKEDGWENNQNNRSIRFREIFPINDVVTYEAFKKIKFDQQYPEKFHFNYNIDTLLLLNEIKYPKLAELIINYKSWNKKGTADSKGAAVFLLLYEYVTKNLGSNLGRPLNEQECVAAYEYAHDYMMKHFGTLQLTLGDIQKLVRGDKVYPVGGLVDLLAPQWNEPYKNGTKKIIGGDAYVMFVRFSKNQLPQIETVNTYGTSARPSSKHFADQIPLFLKQQTKKMNLNKEDVLKNAESVYHPGKQ